MSDATMMCRILKAHEVKVISKVRQGAFSPWTVKVEGDRRGIQGQGNSCYLDSLLFSLFAFSNVMMSKIENVSTKGKWYKETFEVLITDIAKTLRSKGYVKHEVIKKLRMLMAEASQEKKFMDTARDIPECMEVLFQKMLQLDPFVSIK